ncbi:hypothetical protein T02_6468 [Trichinella nativa]|uniref:Uncharacterized protein n=1 Tax=Trichinella nativa TaxID=6335 RepID=A0A0V1L2B6_9BILA|nr:hypothetical protein T02_6468 [Trichinella nativa]
MQLKHVKNAKQSNEDDNKCPPDPHFADKLEIKTVTIRMSGSPPSLCGPFKVHCTPGMFCQEI